MDDQPYSPLFYWMLILGIVGVVGFLIVAGGAADTWLLLCCCLLPIGGALLICLGAALEVSRRNETAAADTAALRRLQAK